MTYYVHETGLCESGSIGKGTRIWAFTHILKGAVIGSDCNICDHVFIENDVCIGDRVTIKCGVQIWDGITIESDVFVGPNVTFTNDPFPRSKVYPETFEKTRICRGASIGANATILPGLEIGINAMIGAGAVVTRTVPPNAIAVGNPARIVGYANATNQKATHFPHDQKTDQSITSALQHVKFQTMPCFADNRGNLSFGEFEKTIPFRVNRYFLVFNVPSMETRGEHAHRDCHQFLICVSGRCSLIADDGNNRQEFLLESPSQGVYLPPMTWGIQYKFSADATLLVFASHYYDPSDYIRNYEEFLSLARKESQD
jgi:UDP-2-acetamido-3-amino-2,3-dideoxy-glucuronate N-acetyltransferase